MTQARRVRLGSCAFILLLVLLMVGWTVREMNQQRRNVDLIAAIKRFDAAEVERQLQAGADPNTVDRPIAPVTWTGVLTECWDRLSRRHPLEQPRDPALRVLFGSDGRVPADRAAPAEAILESLLRHGADPNRMARHENLSVLTLVAADKLAPNDLHALHLLLAHRAAPNHRGPYGQTPLFYARTADVAEALIASGADVNASDWMRATALHVAVANPNNNFDVTECLLRHGASVDAKDSDGMTPLLTNLEFTANSVPTIELLLNYGADVDVQGAQSISLL
jgi:ankyrin repeat protein